MSDWILVRSFGPNRPVTGRKSSGRVSLVEADPDLVPVVTRRAAHNLTAQIYALFGAMRREENRDLRIMGHRLLRHGAQAIVRYVQQLQWTDPLVAVSEVRIALYCRDTAGDYMPWPKAAIDPHGVAPGGAHVFERHLC